MLSAELLGWDASVWVAGALTLILALLWLRGRSRYQGLPALKPVANRAAAAPDCMVVIAARNEEGVIGRAVRSLPPDTVIVVDDHSTDGTAAEAEKAGAGVLPAPALPRNGLGKPNALAFGAAALNTRWVLFADADTCFEPGFLNAAVECAEASGLSLLSIYLDAEYKGFAENVLAPYARALAFAGLSSASDMRGMFRGQCLLVRREPYGFMGGHGAVVTEIAEDVKLTRLAERHRMKMAVVRAPGLGRERLYRGYAGIRSGIERHAFRFMALNNPSGVAVLVATVLAALWLPVLAWLVWAQQWIPAAVFAMVPSALTLPWYRRASALAAPLAIYWILPSLAAGFFSAFFGRAIEWKGRKVRAVS